MSIAISYRLWMGNRSFPSFPVLDMNLPDWLVILQFVCLLVLLLTAAKYQNATIALLALLILYVVQDQMRMQVWVYFYGLSLFPFAFKFEPRERLVYLQCCFVGLYAWSGIHKINPEFVSYVYEGMLVDGLRIEDPQLIIALKKFWWLVPLLEIGTALMLVFSKTRKLGVILGVLGHVCILYYLILGLKGNWVVVPWNLFLLSGLLVLFWSEKHALIPRSKLSKLVLLTAFGMMPLGYRLGYVDHSLSLGLYDGKLQSAYVLQSQSKSKYQLDPSLLEKGQAIDMHMWSFDELQVPFYPEERFVKAYMKKFDSIAVLTSETPLTKRNLNAVYKTPKERQNSIKVNNLDILRFKDSVYLNGYKLYFK